jgi:hypothetical protein
LDIITDLLGRHTEGTDFGGKRGTTCSASERARTGQGNEGARRGCAREASGAEM